MWWCEWWCRFLVWQLSLQEANRHVVPQVPVSVGVGDHGLVFADQVQRGADQGLVLSSEAETRSQLDAGGGRCFTPSHHIHNPVLGSARHFSRSRRKKSVSHYSEREEEQTSEMSHHKWLLTLVCAFWNTFVILFHQRWFNPTKTQITTWTTSCGCRHRVVHQTTVILLASL